MCSTGSQSNPNLQTLCAQEWEIEPSDSEESSEISESDLPECEHWGEIEECKFKHSPSGPHQSLLNEVLMQKQLVECSVPQDPLTEHTVQLTRFAKELKHMIEEISIHIQKVQAGTVLDSSKFFEPICFPPFPENFPLTRRLRDKVVELYSANPSMTPHTISAAMVKDISVKPKTCMKAQEVPHLTGRSHLKLMDRTVAFFLHNAGYNGADPEALRCLTSVLHVFFQNMLRELKVNIDSRTSGDDQKNLEYALEKLFRQRGYGGIKGLLTSFKNKVIDKHQQTLEYWVHLHKIFHAEQQRLKKLLSEREGE